MVNFDGKGLINFDRRLRSRRELVSVRRHRLVTKIHALNEYPAHFINACGVLGTNGQARLRLIMGVVSTMQTSKSGECFIVYSYVFLRNITW